MRNIFLLSFFSARTVRFTEKNKTLREQLDQAQANNKKLEEELRRLNRDFENVRQDFDRKSREWKEEERVRKANRHRFVCFSLDQIEICYVKTITRIFLAFDFYAHCVRVRIK